MEFPVREGQIVLLVQVSVLLSAGRWKLVLEEGIYWSGRGYQCALPFECLNGIFSVPVSPEETPASATNDSTNSSIGYCWKADNSIQTSGLGSI